MCGIAGFHGAPPGGREERRALLARMIGAIAHRGPDERGLHLEDGAGLGHARLSIIDLAAGRQPMASDDGALWLAFNGEIFNYVELREELAARGHRFRTDSDTEVILRLYEERGEACVEAFNGDFAFALWDARRRRLMLARDRMGVRPLYYARTRSGLFFASEVKALLEAPGIEAALDPVALEQIFTFWFPLAPRTPFKGVSELPPGHVLLASDRGVTVRPYWSLTFPDADDPSSLDRRPAGTIAEELRALLADATRIRLRADVPVGAYLSGGLDSSTVTALAQRAAPTRLRTFSVGFEADEFDETPFQQQMVRALGAEHSSVTCTAGEIGRLLPAVIRHTERPLLRTAPAPLFALSRLVRDSGFKVVLTGEGADEVFAGYDLFKEAKIRRFAARSPGAAWRALPLRRLYPYLPGLQAQPQAYLEAFFGARPGDLADPLFSHLPRFRTAAHGKAFFSADLRAAVGGYDALAELRAALPERFRRWHPLSQAQYLETAHLLPGYILSSQGDRVAMAHAVEGRFPFLDHRVVEFAARIPPALKLRVLGEKHILKQATRDLLPPVILARPKQPYRAPDREAFFGPGAPPYVEEALAPAALARTGLFEPRAVARLADKCRRSAAVSARDGMALVGVLSTQLWADAFLKPARTPRAAAERPTRRALEPLSLAT